MTYKRKLIANFMLLFAFFTVAVMFMQYSREKSYKTESLENQLYGYSHIVDRYIQTNGLDDPDDLSDIMPKKLRITVIENKGKVLFDDNSQGIEITENHITRPEIRESVMNKFGTTIRTSDSTGEKYFYLATSFDDYFVRVALPYDVSVIAMLKGNNLYSYFILALFIVVALSLVFISDKLGQSISALRDFAISLSQGNVNKSFVFPDGELGEIGEKLVEYYRLMESSKSELKLEKDKLILHFTHSTIGIAFFSSKMEPIYYNSLFMSHLNIISDEHTLSVEDLFQLPEFSKSLNFIASGEKGVFEDNVYKNGQYFSLRTIVFEDRSIEVIFNNITDVEKTRLLKQEMTNNIAHELRTPVSSISGYLETLLDQKEMPADKRNLFIERTYTQVQRLSGLIRDISIITRIEEGHAQTESEKINIKSVVGELVEEFETCLKKKGNKIENNIKLDIFVNGNANLLYAIFRNLLDNANCYAGEGVVIKIDAFMDDANKYYFSVSDNGVGVSDEHLSKIFNRFYRIGEGRTRQDGGGSGLGLAIVRNAVLFHGGNISAKHSNEGGLEVIFSIAK